MSETFPDILKSDLEDWLPEHEADTVMPDEDRLVEFDEDNR
jgi:hypothetical protein